MARRALNARARAATGLAVFATAAWIGTGCTREPGAGEGRFARVLRPLGGPGEAGAAITIRSRWQPMQKAPREKGLTPRFARTFDRPDEDFPFSPVSAVAPPAIAPAPPVLDGAAAAGGATGLRFPAAQGAVLWWLPARPETRYVVQASVKRALAPTPREGESLEAAEARALVGRLVVIELERPVRMQPLEGRPLSEHDLAFGHHLAEHRAAPSAAGTFAQRRVEVRTSPRTNSLVVLLVAGVPGWWSADASATAAATTPAPEGAVDFDDVALYEVPLASSLVDVVAEGGGDVPAPLPWTSWRRALSLEDELRPALVAVAPTEIVIPCTLPRGRFRLRFAYGIVHESREGFGREPIRFFARLATSSGTVEVPIDRPVLRLRDRAEDAGWQECRYDGESAGGAATLTLATTVEGGRPSQDVALFSEPQIAVLGDAAPPPNVLLVSVDTLRADRIGASRNGLALTPKLDAFARESVTFANARALAPYTLPSHTTLLTGMHPAVHGVESYDSAARAGVHAFLAERFAAAGCATAAFTGGGFMAPGHGLWHGFDRWSTLDPFAPPGDPVRSVRPRFGAAPFNEVMWTRRDGGAIRSWIADRRDEPFFLMVHTYLVHNYRPPAADAARFGAKGTAHFDPLAHSDERTPTPQELAALVPSYDATVAAADREVGALIDALREAGLLDRTLVVVLSDHGEEFGEHGGFGHGRTLYDEVLRVPLLVRVPRIPAHVDTRAVTLADVAPTLLALAGLEPLPNGCGRALIAADGSAVEETPMPITARLEEIHLGTQRALILGSRKVLEVERMSPIRPPLPTLSLFDLERDPGERSDLVLAGPDGLRRPESEQPKELASLRARVAELFARYSEQRATLGVDVDAPLIYNSELDQLGYR